MAYDICKKCQRFFERNGKHYCDKCDDELSQSREKISDYLESRPHASILEIVRDTGVKLKDVNIFLKQGGVISIDNSHSEHSINLRHEEVMKQEEMMNRKESLKMKNKFTPRSLRR